jgi:hypothetical protein
MAYKVSRGMSWGFPTSLKEPSRALSRKHVLTYFKGDDRSRRERAKGVIRLNRSYRKCFPNHSPGGSSEVLPPRVGTSH